ncbi:peptidase M15 [Acinetobacter sp. MD2(2019)]|nr:peptidase M15 [Acinetobacter sp. MD2(2019)]
MLYGCQSNVSKPVISSPSTTGSVITPPRINLPARAPAHHSPNLPPSVNYQNWLLQDNHLQQVSSYKQFLLENNIRLPVADEEFFRSARNWQACHLEEFSVPQPELWQNMRPTLTLLNTLLAQKIISDIELTSSYRPSELNACVGGAKSSSHLSNNAVDFRIGPEQPSLLDQDFIQQNKLQLCKFWQQHGKTFNMGLGVYSTGQIHIDTKGFRTWGVDHTWHSSPCAEIIP